MDKKSVEVFERGWMVFALAMLLLFTGLILHAILTHGAQIATVERRAPPAEILAKARFAQPGLVQVGPNQFELTVIAQAFSFVPNEVVVPAGAEITFFLTSRDVLHSYQVQFTTINVNLIPGEVATLRYTFREPGEHLVICGQYCGIGHHNMLGLITVVSPEEFVAQAQPVLKPTAPEPPAEPGEVAVALPDGGAIYAASCLACHQAAGQGIPGVFPPLAGHAPNLYNIAGGREYLIKSVLYGLIGPITVGGRTYNALMPAFPHLTDADIAAVVNHTLTAWGNEALLAADFAPLTSQEVTALRGLGLTPSDVHTLRQGLGLE
ncbi:MAG: c-type cytochrome [Truepera sp.]|nr:c-type cytochrome [Truepera sp.]